MEAQNQNQNQNQTQTQTTMDIAKATIGGAVETTKQVVGVAWDKTKQLAEQATNYMHDQTAPGDTSVPQSEKSLDNTSDAAAPQPTLWEKTKQLAENVTGVHLDKEQHSADGEATQKAPEVIEVDVKPHGEQKAPEDLVRRLSQTPDKITLDDINQKLEEAEQRRNTELSQKLEHIAVDEKIEAAHARAETEEAKAARARAEKEQGMMDKEHHNADVGEAAQKVPEVIEVDVKSHGDQKAPEDLVRRLSQTPDKITLDDINQKLEEAEQRRKAELSQKLEQIAVDEKIEAAHARAETDEAKAARARAEKEQGLMDKEQHSADGGEAIQKVPEVIEVDVKTNGDQKAPEDLVRRLSQTPEKITLDDINQKLEEAEQRRKAELSQKLEQIAVDEKIEAAHARAETDEAKAARARAEKEQGMVDKEQHNADGEATQQMPELIEVDVKPHGEQKAPEDLVRRLSQTPEKITLDDINQKLEEAEQRRNAELAQKVEQIAIDEKIEAARARVKAAKDIDQAMPYCL